MSTSRPDLRRFRDAGSTDSAVQVEAARIAARRGNREEASQLLRLAVQADPKCAEAWLGLAWLAETAAERKVLLHRVLALDPDNSRAKAEVARLQPEISHAAAAIPGGRRGGSSPAARPTPLPSGTRTVRAAPSAAEGPLERRGQPKQRGGRVLTRALEALGVVALILLLLALIAWGPVSGGLASLLPAVPTSTPNPTLSPGEVAARFVPQLENALLNANWDRAMELVTIMQALAPSDPVVTDWARKAHVQAGQALVWEGLAGDALTHFDEALAAAPGDAEALLWQSTTQAYLAGRQGMLAGDWAGAITSFLLVQAQIPDYGDGLARLVEAYRGLGQAAVAATDWTAAIDALKKAQEIDPTAAGILDPLELAYRERGIAQEEAGALTEARADLEAALALAPGDAKAKTHLDRVLYRLFPPKRIEIDISEQRMYVYLGDTLLYKWVISTGLPGRDTATGHYKVLDKLPMAYSKVWNLKMPYWLGIYYVGGIENGIHALPIRPDGTVMWAGFLGQKASYGCIILDNTAAPILYNWAEVGTRVDIRN